MKTVIAGITFTKDSNDLRARLNVETVLKARELGIPVVVVDGGSPAEFTSKLQEAGAEVFTQLGVGMGSAHRQSIALAWERSEDGAVFKTELEKFDLVRFIEQITRPILKGRVDIGVPKRTRRSLATYAPEQIYGEMIQSLAFEYLTGIKWGWFGPVAIGPKAIDLFLQCEETDWLTLAIPQLRAVKKGLVVETALVDYRHPKEQTDAERGNFSFIMKRLEQARLVVDGLWNEAKQLEMVE